MPPLIKIWSAVHDPDGGGALSDLARNIESWEAQSKRDGLNPRVALLCANNTLFLVGRATQEDPKVEERLAALESQNRQLEGFARDVEGNMSRMATALQSMMDSRIVRPL